MKLVIFHLDYELIGLAMWHVNMLVLVEQPLVPLEVQQVPNVVWKLFYYKVFSPCDEVVNKLDSFHIWINGYQIDVGIWSLILLTNRNYYWCKYTCYGYETTTWIVDCHCCCVKITSSNCWTCSWLPPLWIFTTCGWVDAYAVIWWVIEGTTGSLYTTNLVAIWCSLVFTFHIISMFGAFTSLFPISCTYYSSCICADFDTGWCIT